MGLVGFPIDITSMISFDEAVISFHYNEAQLGTAKEENLCILWYDEENLQYVLLEDSVVDVINHTVSCTTTHFSTYLLVDKEIWIDAWRKDLNYDKGRLPVADGVTYDICLCLDYSVSAGELEQEKQFARKIIKQMIKGDRVKIGVYLPNTLNTYCQGSWMTSSKEALSALNSIENDLYKQFRVSLKPRGNYYSDNYQAIYMLTTMQDMSSKNQKIGFLINAGKNEDVTRYFIIRSKEQADADLKALGFPVHAVSVTDETNKELEVLLKEYGGSSFNMTSLDKVERKYGYQTENFDMLDSDGDGLFDTYEVNGIRIQNGTIIYTDPYKTDSDNDGISDFDEVGGLPEMLLVSQNNYVSTINYQKSDPNDPNSTGKNIIDGYMIINEFPCWPYSEKDYEDIFVKNTGKKNANGEKIYGLYNIYNSNPSELSGFEVERIRTLVEIESSLVEIVTFDGTKYILNLRYYIFDYYDWDENQTARLGLVSDSELYKLCRCGAARFYENWGEYMTQIIWEPTIESGQDALNAEKDKLERFSMWE